MIYFDRDARMRLVRMLEDALNPGGYLMIGHAELLTAGKRCWNPFILQYTGRTAGG